MTTHRVQLSLLWLVMVVGMMLHFDYHVSGIFYGIELKRPNATGEFPPTIWLIRFVFQLAPMMAVTFLLFFEAQWFRVAHFGVSILYTLAHASHLIREFEKPDMSQLNLLSLVLVVSLLLNIVSLRWLKEGRGEIKAQDSQQVATSSIHKTEPASIMQS